MTAHALDSVLTLRDAIGTPRTLGALCISRRTLEKWRAGTHPVPVIAGRLAVIYCRFPELLPDMPLRDTTPRRIVDRHPVADADLPADHPLFI